MVVALRAVRVLLPWGVLTEPQGRAGKKGSFGNNAAKLSKGPSGPLLFVKYEPCELSWPVSASG